VTSIPHPSRTTRRIFVQIMNPPRIGQALALLILAALSTSVGCGPSGIADVHGRVTVGGQPAPEGLSIEFLPTVPGEVGPSMAVVKADGSYVAKNAATNADGVALGICVARLVENELTTTLPQKEGQMPKPKYDPKQYKELAKFEVKAGSNTVDLELEPAKK
jgi:hypothetical protein